MEKILKKSIRIYNTLSKDEKKFLIDNSKILCFKKGHLVHKGDETCLGLIAVNKGSLKAFISSDSGKQITLYKLYEGDICLFTAACKMKNIHFDINLICEEDCEILLLPVDLYEEILKKSKKISNYINEIVMARFSDVMWILEQTVFHSLDKRLANYLLNLNKKDIEITHQKIADELGTAREVISRLLKHFENDNILKLNRNKITIINNNALLEIAEK